MFIKLTNGLNNKPIWIDTNYVVCVRCGNDFTIIDYSCGEYYAVTETIDQVMAMIQEALHDRP